MRTHALALLTLTIMVTFAGRPSDAQEPGKTAGRPKKVLVELYASQGCDSCPAASDLVGRLAELGYGPDRIETIDFHVDYFNDPWVDPFSSAEHSQRQQSYNVVQKRTDLYFTPLMMVDGRTPLLGSNRPKAVASLEKALKDRPGVSLGLDLNSRDETSTMNVRVSASSKEVVGRALLICAAVVEDPVTTQVRSGENGGKMLVEHHAVRSFAQKTIRLGRTGAESLTFPLKLGNDCVRDRCRVVVFAQDQADGHVYQADSLPWVPKVPDDGASGSAWIYDAKPNGTEAASAPRSGRQAELAFTLTRRLAYKQRFRGNARQQAALYGPMYETLIADAYASALNGEI